jgi:hypothetical protein
MSKRNRNCLWHCGRETKNVSRICDNCWQASEQLRELTDEGHKAWLERKRAKEAASQKRPRTARQQAHTEKLKATRRPKLAKQLPTSEVLVN